MPDNYDQDVNTALAEARIKANQIVCVRTWIVDDAIKLAKAFQALDKFIKKNKMLPNDWQNPDVLDIRLSDDGVDARFPFPS